MKFALYAMVAVLAMVPACAQNAARTHNLSTPAQVRHAGTAPRPADEKNERAAAAELLQNYARCVDGLLLDLANRLHAISERTEAGDLTPEEEQTLKLAATRAMIARLETISAIFDALVVSEDESEDSNEPGNDPGGDAPAAIVLRAQSTVSINELRRERER